MPEGTEPLAPISPHAFRLLREVEDRHWWFDGMEAITKRILDKIFSDEKTNSREGFASHVRQCQILDAGCGTGRNIVFLTGYGSVIGLDHSTVALNHCQQRGFQRLIRGSVNQMPFADGEFDLVTCFDVLITDGINDEMALREFARVLRPGGCLFVRVAAYDWLRSHHDIEWAVRHRYNRSEIASKLATAGLEIRLISYANTWLLPVALLKRILERVHDTGASRSDLKIGSRRSLGSRLLRATLVSEASWISGPGLPCGLSLIALARKPIR